MDYESLLPFCETESQRRVIEACIEAGSQRKAAKTLDRDIRNVQRSIERVKLLATKAKGRALKGDAPEYGLNNKAAPGFALDRYSDMRLNDDGKPIWYKYSRERAELDQGLRGFAESLCDEMPQAKPTKLPPIKKHTTDLMTGIFIGDAHIGMYAYGKETKHSDFDTDIATKQLRDAIDYLVEKAEPTETGLLVDVGDFMHANGQSNTTYSGTPLDVDTRHYRAMKKAGIVMRYMIDRMLTKFKNVVVIVARGNHNTDAAPAVQLMLDFHYEREKRVKILPTEGFYHYLEYGKWLLGVTHGDKQKPEALASSMARDMAQAWGRTTHRMWCCGHFHKEQVKTLPGVKVKVFAALPPPDSWHASHGFAGDGEMEMLTFRRDGGLYSSHVYNIPQPRIEPDVKI